MNKFLEPKQHPANAGERAAAARRRGVRGGAGAPAIGATPQRGGGGRFIDAPRGSLPRGVPARARPPRARAAPRASPRPPFIHSPLRAPPCALRAPARAPRPAPPSHSASVSSRVPRRRRPSDSRVDGRRPPPPASCLMILNNCPRFTPAAALRAQVALLGGDAERGVRGAVAAVAAAALDDLEEEALAEVRAVELEILAVLVAVVEDVQRPQPVGEVGVEAEARLDVVVVVGRDRQRLEAVGGQRRRGGEDVARGEGEVLDGGAERLGDEAAGEGAGVLGAVQRQAQRAVGVLDRLAADDARGVDDVDASAPSRCGRSRCRTAARRASRRRAWSGRRGRSRRGRRPRPARRPRRRRTRSPTPGRAPGSGR